MWLCAVRWVYAWRTLYHHIEWQHLLVNMSSMGEKEVFHARDREDGNKLERKVLFDCTLYHVDRHDNDDDADAVDAADNNVVLQNEQQFVYTVHCAVSKLDGYACNLFTVLRRGKNPSCLHMCVREWVCCECFSYSSWAIVSCTRHTLKIFIASKYTNPPVSCFSRCSL